MISSQTKVLTAVNQLVAKYQYTEPISESLTGGMTLDNHTRIARVRVARIRDKAFSNVERMRRKLVKYSVKHADGN